MHFEIVLGIAHIEPPPELGFESEASQRLPSQELAQRCLYAYELLAR